MLKALIVNTIKEKVVLATGPLHLCQSLSYTDRRSGTQNAAQNSGAP